MTVEDVFTETLLIEFYRQPIHLIAIKFSCDYGKHLNLVLAGVNMDFLYIVRFLNVVSVQQTGNNSLTTYYYINSKHITLEQKYEFLFLSAPFCN